MRVTKRSPFLEGRMGSPRMTIPTNGPLHNQGKAGIPWDNQPHLLPPHDQMEDGFLKDHLLNPQHPAQPNADMGCLINTLMPGLHLGTPRINTFSGKATPRKTEVSFEQWYHEVQGIKDHYPELVVQESIMRSLKRAVADMARYMDPNAIVQKLMAIFGTVASFDVLMQNFYKVTQGNHEKGALIRHKARRDFISNLVKMPQTDSQLWGALVPQGLSFPWGLQAYLGLHQVFS